MLKHHNYENKDLQQILETFSHYQQVSFAFYCAKDVESIANDPRIIDCNQVLQRWLKGDQTVDLEIARNNAWNAWNDANVYSASSAASASASASASSAASASASSAASASASASSAASVAANAKSSNLYPNDETKRNVVRNQFLKEYNQIAQNWLSYWEIPNFPKDEPDFPIFDFLQDYNLISYLLPKNDNVYYLNLNGFDLKHDNEAELLKIINTTHIKNIIRRIINNDSAQQL